MTINIFDLHFFSTGGKLSGVHQSYLLLDNTRINSQNIAQCHPFLIFAWIAVGADDSLKRDLNITPAIVSDFKGHELAASPTYEEDMRRNLQYLHRLLVEMGMDESIWNGVIRILAAVMHLQRLQVSGSDAAALSAATKNHVAYAETALQMEAGTLGPILLKKKMDISGSISYKNLTQEDSKAVIYTVGAELYSLVFDFLLDFCADYTNGRNEVLGPCLRIVDIGGNESQTTPPNGIPEFCNNLFDEKLNQHQLNRCFQREVEFLRKEGVTAPGLVEISDPEPILSLLEYPPAGIISLIEEASLFPRGNDNALLDKIFSTHSKGKLVKTAGRGSKTSFVVKHSFGDVQYDIDGFVAANKMRISADGKELIKDLVGSHFQFLERVAKSEAQEEDSSGSTKARRAMDKSAVKGAFITNVFRDKSTELINTFSGSEVEGDADPLFVFCIRGSADLKSFTFDPSYVQSQVKFMNFAQMATFCKEGFASRQVYKEFYERYRVMFSYKFDGLPWKMPTTGDPKALVRGLLRECASLAAVPQLLDDENIAPVFGKTYMFLKEKSLELLETTRSDVLRKYAQAVILIQAGSRMKLAKKKYKTLSRGIVMAQTVFRMWKCLKKYRNTLESARRIQGYHRMKKLSSKFKETKNAVMVIKRRLLDKMILRIRYKKLQRASRSLQFLARGFVIRQQINYVIRAVLKLQSLARDFLKRNRLFYFRKIAIVLIQKVFRGMYVRHRNRPIVKALKIRRNQRIGTAAVKKLQSKWRMKRVRGRFMEIVKATNDIQRWFQSRKEREIYLKKLTVVKWLQCLTRKIVATNYTHSLRVEEMLKQEMQTLNLVRQNELRAVPYKDMSTEQFPSSRIGGGYYKNAREKYGRYLIGLDLNFDISVAYPKGWTTSLLKFDEALRSSGQKRLSMIAVGRTHTVLVDTSSNVFTFGLGDSGQLGHGTFTNELEPRSLDTLGYQAAAAEGRGIAKHVSQKVEVLMIAAGRDHTLLLTGSRRVYSWGSNRRGQLGHSNFKNSSLPRLVQGPINVKEVVCGAYHSASLADPGILHCWGARECLGRPSESDCSEAHTLPFFVKRRVQLVVAGETHVTVRSGCDFYSWGLNTFGQLGRGAPRESGKSLKTNSHAGVEEQKTPIDVSANYAQSDDGDEDGDNDSVAMSVMSSASQKPGHNPLIPPKVQPKRVGHSAVPVRVDLPSQNWSEGDLMGCTLISGGRHVLLVNKGRIWGWGWNRYGQVGDGTLSDVFTPVQIQVNGPRSSLALRVGLDKISKKVGTNAVLIKSVVAGWRHSMISTQGGVVFVWGMAGLHASSVSLMPPSKPAESKEKGAGANVAHASSSGAIPAKAKEESKKSESGLESAATNSKQTMEPLAVLKSDNPSATVLTMPHLLDLPLRMQSHDVLRLYGCSSSSFSMSAVELLEKDEPTQPLFKTKHKSTRQTESLHFHNSATMQKEISERVRNELGGWSRAAFQSAPKKHVPSDVESVSASSVSSSPIVPEVWGDKLSGTTSRGKHDQKTNTRSRTTPRSTSCSSESSAPGAAAKTKPSRLPREGELSHESLLELFSPVRRPVSYNYSADGSIDMDKFFRSPEEDTDADVSTANKQHVGIAQARKEADARRRLSFHSIGPVSVTPPDSKNVSLASKARKRRSSVATLRRSDLEESVDTSPPISRRTSPLQQNKSRSDMSPPALGLRTPRQHFGNSTGDGLATSTSLSKAFPASSSSPPPDNHTATRPLGSTKRGQAKRDDDEVNSLQQSVQSLKAGMSRARLSSPQRRMPQEDTMAPSGDSDQNLGLDMIAVSDLAAMIQSIKKESLQQMSMSWRLN